MVLPRLGQTDTKFYRKTEFCRKGAQKWWLTPLVLYASHTPALITLLEKTEIVPFCLNYKAHCVAEKQFCVAVKVICAA